MGNKNLETVELNMPAKRNKASVKEQIVSKRGTKLQNMGNQNLETMKLNMPAKRNKASMKEQIKSKRGTKL
jgi:hypothetical protein